MRYPAEEPMLRMNRIRKEMEKKGLDALVFYSCQWKVEFLHYIANFRVLGKDACMVLPLQGEPTLFISHEWDEARAITESWISNVVVIPERMLDVAGRTAAKCGKRVGIVGIEIMPNYHYADLEAALIGKEVTNEFDLLDCAAMVKTSWEIEIIRKCAALADEGFKAEVNALREGISEYELVAEIEYAMKKGGADDNFQMVGMGVGLPSMNLATENTLKMGDLVLTEITPMIGCITYATQLCKTVKMGPATEVEKEKYALLCEGLEYALSKAKAGIKAKDICNWQNEVIGGAGYEKYCHPPYMRSRGHNFGLGLLELAEDNETVLEKDMVMVVHPNQYIPEVGYLVCGETIRITEDGIERLSKIPAKLFEILPRM